MAVALTVVILLLVSASFFGLRRTMTGQGERRDGPVAALTVLRQMQAELAGAYPAAATGREPPFTAGPPTNAGPSAADFPELRFLAYLPPAGADGPPVPEAVRLAYRVGEARADGMRPLERIVQPLAGPAAALPPRTSVVLTATARFGVECHDGTNWVTRWPPSAEAATDRPLVPPAVRLTLSLPPGTGRRTWTAEAAVPAGQSITSRVERAGATIPRG